MKHLSLILVMFSSNVLAQTTAPGINLPQSRRALITPGQKAAVSHLDQNYQITLKMMEKEGAPIEVALVVASPEFTASLSDQI